MPNRGCWFGGHHRLAFVDEEGKNGVWVTSPKGKHHTVLYDTSPYTNLTWGPFGLAVSTSARVDVLGPPLHE
jgi:hypothetical protein